MTEMLQMVKAFVAGVAQVLQASQSSGLWSGNIIRNEVLSKKRFPCSSHLLGKRKTYSQLVPENNGHDHLEYFSSTRIPIHN